MNLSSLTKGAASLLIGAALIPTAAFADAGPIDLEAFVGGTNDFATCEIKSGGNFFEQELRQDSLYQANQAVGNAPTGIQLEATGDVRMEVSGLTEVLPGDSSINLAESYIDVKLAGGGFGNRVLTASASGEGADFTNLRGATTNVQMNDARIQVDGGMNAGQEYRINTVLTCVVSD